MILCDFTATGPAFNHSTMNFSVYQKYSSVKREAICLTVKAWLKVGHLTGQ